jgi:hypothetical protein
MIIFLFTADKICCCACCFIPTFEFKEDDGFFMSTDENGGQNNDSQENNDMSFPDGFPDGFITADTEITTEQQQQMLAHFDSLLQVSDPSEATQNGQFDDVEVGHTIAQNLCRLGLYYRNDAGGTAKSAPFVVIVLPLCIPPSSHSS